MSNQGQFAGAAETAVPETASDVKVIGATLGDLFRLIDPVQEIAAAVSSLGQILHVTDNVRAVLGFSREELVGRSLFTHVHPDDLPRAQRAFRQRSGRGHYRHRHKDGSWSWFYVTSTEVMVGSGDAERILIARDLAVALAAREEGERLKAELVRMEHFASLGLLAGGVAHDLNNILTAMAAYATRAHSETTQPGVADALEHILKAVQRAGNLTRGVVASLRRNENERLPTELAAIVDEAVALLRPLIAKNVVLEVHLDSAAGSVVANGCQIHRVVLNLCHNALQAMKPMGGRLTVELKRVPIAETPKLLRAWRGDGSVCLSVTDTGRGMTSDEQQRIFEPLFTTKAPHEGCGLGLAVVDHVMRDHGGVVTVSSQPGQGSCFRLWFPMLTAVSTEATGNASAAPSPRSPAAPRDSSHGA